MIVPLLSSIRIESMTYFLTGTDTNIGKTLISCALLHHFAAQGQRVIGMKPVAAGVNVAGEYDDVVQLCAASNVSAALGDINPYCFAPAIAPHLAAQQAGIRIAFPLILAAFHTLAKQADTVIVEGVGGWRVPLNEAQDSADLAKALNLPVILVVGMRLGCLSHALLTVESIAASGLTLAGWVANCVDETMTMREENIAALQQRIDAPLLGVVPFQRVSDAKLAAGYLQWLEIKR
jgi:dethiobiotin synthetase